MRACSGRVVNGRGYRVDPRGFPLVQAYTSPEQCELGTASEAAEAAAVRITAAREILDRAGGSLPRARLT
jgi:hypothetical protein